MKLNNIKWLAVLSLLTVLSACSGDDRPDTSDGGITGTGFQIDGTAQKGPFVIGSSVNVTQLTAVGESTDKSLLTQTKDSLGNFSFVMSNQGPTLITTEGYHYNELTGKASTDQLTLRAIYNVSSEQEQSANVNILTHLIHSRVLKLMSEGVEVDKAIAQAEKEWLESFKTVAESEVSTGFNQLNLYEESETNIQKGNDYLLFTSAVFYQYATNLTQGDDSSLGVKLAQVLNNTAADFKSDGDIDSNEVVDQLIIASTQVDFESVKKNLENLSLNITGGVLPVANFKDLLTQVVILSPANGQTVSNTIDVKFSIPQGLTNASYELLVGGEKGAELNSHKITAQDIEAGVLSIPWQPYYFSSNANGRKSLVIQASAGGSRALSNIVNVDISPSVNQAITVESPINNAVLRGQSQVELNWSAVVDAKKYTVQVSNDNFRTLLKDIEVTEPKFIADELTQAQYQWRVKATNQYDKTGPFSNSFDFEMKGSVAPTELSSQVSYQDKKYSVSLTWKADKPTDSYQLQIAKDDNFEELVESPIANSNELIKDMALGKYYWRVKVDNQDGFDGDWSEVKELSVGVFEKNFGQKGDYAKDVIATQDGGALVLAVSKAIDKTEGDDWLIKFDLLGNIEWELKLEKSGKSVINRMKVFEDGYAYAAGKFKDTGGNTRGYLAKIDLSKEPQKRIVWEQNYQSENSNYDVLKDVEDLDNKLLVIGSRKFETGRKEHYIYDFDKLTGNLLNDKKISYTSEKHKLIEVNMIKKTKYNEFLVACNAEIINPPSFWKRTACLIKLDERFDIEWEWNANTELYYSGLYLAETVSNNIALVGEGFYQGTLISFINNQGLYISSYADLAGSGGRVNMVPHPENGIYTIIYDGEETKEDPVLVHISTDGKYVIKKRFDFGLTSTSLSFYKEVAYFLFNTSENNGIYLIKTGIKY